jgi:hypothetical protein
VLRAYNQKSENHKKALLNRSAAKNRRWVATTLTRCCFSLSLSDVFYELLFCPSIATCAEGMGMGYPFFVMLGGYISLLDMLLGSFLIFVVLSVYTIISLSLCYNY